MFVSDLGNMPALEEAYWIAKCRDKPLPTQQIIAHLAQIAQYIQMTNVEKKDRGVLADFILFRDKPPPPGDSAATIRENFDRLIKGQRK